MVVHRSPPKNQPSISSYISRKRPATQDPEVDDQPAHKSQRKQEEIQSATVSQERESPKTATDETEDLLPDPDMTEQALKQLLEGQTRAEKRLDDLMKALEPVQKKLKEHEERIESLEEVKTEHNKALQKLLRENKHLQKKLRENNLIIHGIPEERNETKDSVRELVLEKFKELGLPTIDLDQAFRIGKPTNRKGRLIKIRLTKLSDKEKLLACKFTPGITIREDLPPELAAERKIIGKLVRWAKDNGKSARAKGSYAIIDGKEVHHDEALELLKNSGVPMEQ